MVTTNITGPSWPSVLEGILYRCTVSTCVVSILVMLAEGLPSGFLPSELTDHHCDGFEFKEVSVDKILQGNYEKLGPDCANLIKHSVDRMPWRFNIHQPYEYWYKGRACILGDAAHPMLVSCTHLGSVPPMLLQD